MMPTLGSAMSNVRVRHGQRLYSLGMMNICVGPSASGKGYIVRIRQGVYSKAARTVKKNGIAS